MINVSREPQNQHLLYVNEDLRNTVTLLSAQKRHYAMISHNIKHLLIMNKAASFNKTKSFLLLLIAFSLCSLMMGCNPLEPFRPDSAELLKLGWAKQPKCPKTPEPVYCYETLGHPVCHSAPLESQSRLNSYYGPQP